MKKNELFGLKNMFPSNNIASVGVKSSCPHTEGHTVVKMAKRDLA